MSVEELTDLTAVQRADAYKQGQLAGHLERADEGITFSYTRDWMVNDGLPVATTLPVTTEPVTTPAGGVPAYFAGLLPEGRRLSALRRNVKTSSDDELSLVLAVGSDPVGDVQIVPANQLPSRAAPRLTVRDFSEVRFADLLAELDIHIDRVGMAGVQDKASLAMLNVPVTAAGTSYLLKLNSPEFKCLVENEAFFLARAPRSGVQAAVGTIVRDVDGVPGLVVTRFDRFSVNGAIHAMGMEDGCQVLGLHPEAKYRVPAEDVLRRLSSLCEAPRPAVAELLRQLVYAYVTGNGDAHAKNFSILADQHGRWSPAPAYDVPSSQPYGDHTMALSLAEQRDGNIPGKRFISLGEQLGLPTRAATRAVRDTARRADGWIDELHELPFDTGQIAKLRRVIQHRQRMLLHDQ